MITLAPEIAAPDGSVTCPLSAPAAFWPNNGIANTEKQTTRGKMILYFDDFIAMSLPFL
jgi:hypothetical protein